MSTTMSVTRALAELKLLDKRIKRKIVDATFGGYQVGKKVMTGFDTVEDIKKTAQSDFDSIKDLIKRRNMIKSKIVLSNANTKVKIAGREYTVAEAIERKTSIEYEQQLLNKLKNVYQNLTEYVDSINDQMQSRLDKHLEQLFGKEGKTNVENTESVVKSFKEQNEAKLIDPLNFKQTIEELEQEIEDFLSEVDFVLSTSNAITMIEIDD